MNRFRHVVVAAVGGAMLTAACAFSAPAFAAVRDYLSGAPFSGRPAAYSKSWLTRSVTGPSWRLDLDSEGLAAQTLWPSADPGLRLVLADFDRQKGRRVPRTLKVIGKDFSLSLRFDSVKLEFKTPAAQPAQAI